MLKSKDDKEAGFSQLTRKGESEFDEAYYHGVIEVCQSVWKTLDKYSICTDYLLFQNIILLNVFIFFHKKKHANHS